MLKHCVETMFGDKGEGLLQACISSYLFIPIYTRVNANIAKCKVIVSVMDGFRRYAHARVITDFKNMADYMNSEQPNTG